MTPIFINGNIVDIPGRTIAAGTVSIEGQRISAIEKTSDRADPSLPYILPGFIDSHVHIESSMLVPAEFARLAVVHGTVATVSDPHEIANVCGKEGVNFMVRNGRTVPFKFFFGAPSCVPATGFETSGHALSPAEVEELLQQEEIRYLSEMMNFPGVIARDPAVMEKIAAAKRYGKPVDGHAPGLSGEELRQYVSAGITTDHECVGEAEALEKLGLGMTILIREGSAAKNFEALAPLIGSHPGKILFCSDDKHPDSLVKGHINELCRRAVAKGIDPFAVLEAACIQPVRHYGLPVGLLRKGDPADLILVNNLREFRVDRTYINGECVAEGGKSQIISHFTEPVNHFSAEPLRLSELECPTAHHLEGGKIPAIEAFDGQLITAKYLADPREKNGLLLSDPGRDLLKIVVVNRYHKAPPAKAFIRGFGFRQGAIASSVAHDSHNIIAVGADDESLLHAINLLIGQRGGISCTATGISEVLPLPVAGLMSNADGYQVAAAYTAIDTLARSLGSPLSSPFMTLSFMALLVIPSLKLSDRGLFDADRFRFVFNQPKT